KEFSVFGELGQTLSGLKAEEISSRLQPIVQEMTTYVAAQLDLSSRLSAQRTVKPVLALGRLSRKHLKALEKADGN
ncbi:unnamed protein product, partial [Scytosiphon promiscuus]